MQPMHRFRLDVSALKLPENVIHRRVVVQFPKTVLFGQLPLG